jgi:hypothetical protein
LLHLSSPPFAESSLPTPSGYLSWLGLWIGGAARPSPLVAWAAQAPHGKRNGVQHVDIYPDVQALALPIKKKGGWKVKSKSATTRSLISGYGIAYRDITSPAYTDDVYVIHMFLMFLLYIHLYLIMHERNGSYHTLQRFYSTFVQYLIKVSKGNPSCIHKKKCCEQLPIIERIQFQFCCESNHLKCHQIYIKRSNIYETK